MGDMADMHLVNIEENAVHRGEDWYTANGMERNQSGKKTCKHCNTENLRWVMRAKKWRLISAKGKIHDCIEYRNRNRLKTNAK